MNFIRKKRRKNAKETWKIFKITALCFFFIKRCKCIITQIGATPLDFRSDCNRFAKLLGFRCSQWNKTNAIETSVQFRCNNNNIQFYSISCSLYSLYKFTTYVACGHGGGRQQPSSTTCPLLLRVIAFELELFSRWGNNQANTTHTHIECIHIHT